MSDVKIECKLVIEAKIYKIPYDKPVDCVRGVL